MAPREMAPRERTPVVGIPACLVAPEGYGFHQVGAKYVDGVIDGAGGMPLLIPAVGDRIDPDALLDGLDGLLLSGSPSNVEPHHYEGPLAPPGGASDPARDATTLPLIRRAIARAVPLFAICRGIQELNVALGGSLHQEVHALQDRLDHRSDKAVALAERYGPAHEVLMTPDGMLRQLLGRVDRIVVNSLHGQAIDRLAPGLVVEAVAPDGMIEAVRLEGAPGFVLGVQWHPEWRLLEQPSSRRLFAAFGAACRARAAARSNHERHGALAS
jgi:putative glutamine amidotransferase